MCSSDKQNMDGIKIDNVVSKGFLWLVKSLEKLLEKSFQKANRRNIPKVNDIEEVRAEIKKLVEKARGVIDNGECLDWNIDEEDYGDAIDYLFHNKLIEDQDLEQMKRCLDELVEQLNDLIRERSTNQSSGSNINIQPDNVKRCLLFLSNFPELFVFNLKRVTRLSVPNEVIPEKLEELSPFLDIIDEDSKHFLLKTNRINEIKNFPKRDNLSRKTEQNKRPYPSHIFNVGTNITDPTEFEHEKFMLLRYLSLRRVRNGQNLNLNKLSSLKYLDLKHTNVENCRRFERLEKLQMLDLRYTNVKEIPDNILEKLGKLQHLLLGYIEGGENQLAGTELEVKKLGGENQLAGTKLNVKKLNTTNLKTLRAIEKPDEIKDIRNVHNAVDLSVTGLTTDSLPDFWDTLETYEFENLTSLGVAVTDNSVIRLQDCKAKLKKNLKRLRMEGLHSGLEKLGGFEKLNDLTLASHINMDIKKIPGLPKLLCLRLYGVCKEPTCKIDLKGFGSLKKLVIGDMGEVETVQIGSAVLKTVVTLKFSNLPKLKKVAYTDKPDSLLRWGNKTIFLRHSGDFPVENSPGLKIYQYDVDMQCYKLNPTKNNQG